MLKYLIKIPCELLGHNMLGFLEFIDIVQFENAAASQKSQQLLNTILPYCPPITLSDSFYRVKLKWKAFDWFKERFCRFQFVKIDLESLSEFNLEYSMMNNNIELCLKNYATLKLIETLQNSHINEKIFRLEIHLDQDPAVMKVLFSLLGSVRCLDIKTSSLSPWIEHIKKIGHCLREIALTCLGIEPSTILTVTEYCPYLEKLLVGFVSFISDSSIVLQSIASNCTHIRFLHIKLSYYSSDVGDADLTAFAEKCPQLEELSLHCPQLTDQSVIALAQHCSGLKILKFSSRDNTVASMIALSERGLPLEELDIIPRIPIPSAEIAAQCAHALSRIRELCTYNFNHILDHFLHAIPYMAGLRELYLDSREDHLLVPQLLLLLQGHCVHVVSIITGWESSISPPQLMELTARCPKLHILYGGNSAQFDDAALVELAHSCPHLWKISLYSSEVTEEGVLSFAVRCRQMRDLDLGRTTVTEETVIQLAQHCRHLTRLRVNVNVRKGEVSVEHFKDYNHKQIRALRVIESSHVEVSHMEVRNQHSNNTCCLIM